MLDLLTKSKILATLCSEGGVSYEDEQKYPAGAASDAGFSGQ
jgi:hypothetical protein